MMIDMYDRETRLCVLPVQNINISIEGYDFELFLIVSVLLVCQRKILSYYENMRLAKNFSHG
jgi:hypothetical protein